MPVARYQTLSPLIVAPLSAGAVHDTCSDSSSTVSVGTAGRFGDPITALAVGKDPGSRIEHLCAALAYFNGIKPDAFDLDAADHDRLSVFVQKTRKHLCSDTKTNRDGRSATLPTLIVILASDLSNSTRADAVATSKAATSLPSAHYDPAACPNRPQLTRMSTPIHAVRSRVSRHWRQHVYKPAAMQWRVDIGDYLYVFKVCRNRGRAVVGY